SALVLYEPHSVPALSSFNAPLPSALYTLSLHDALPIFKRHPLEGGHRVNPIAGMKLAEMGAQQTVLAPGEDLIADEFIERHTARSEEHTSELQSLAYLVCRLLLEKKKSDASSC